MSTKIETFESLKAELKVLRATTTLSAVNRDHGKMGGMSTEIIITAPVEVCKWLVEWLNKEPAVAINKGTALCKIEVEKARLEAVAEADAFKVANATATV